MFFNGKKQQVQQKQDDEKMKKFLAQLEQFDLEDRDEQKQSSEKKSRKDLQDTRKTDIIPMGFRYESPEKIQQFNVFITEQKSKKPLEPPYLKNSLLFFKIRNLPSTQIGQKLLQIRYSILSGSTWIRPVINRQQFKPKKDIIQYDYFDLNYDFKNTDWIDHHYRLISWKLYSKGRFSQQRCLQELEYRYFIENVLSLRNTFIKMTTGDDVIAGHFVLFISSMEIVRKRIIIELSDGWYSVFLISEIDPIHKQFKIGMKLHVCNMYRYPIQIDLSQSKIINSYKFPYMLVATSLNSIKKASVEMKLGRQQTPYFLRSIQSSRRGLIPCLDVYIIEVSYLLTSDMKRAIKATAEIDTTLSYNFFITVVDSINYFENKPKAKAIPILCLRAKFNNFEYLQKGQRVRLINVIQIDDIFKLQFGDSNKGILGEDLKQFTYKPIIEYDKLEIQIEVEVYMVKQTRGLLIGRNELGIQTVDVDHEFFQGIFGQHLVGHEILLSQLTKHQNIYQTTLMTKLYKL